MKDNKDGLRIDMIENTELGEKMGKFWKIGRFRRAKVHFDKDL